MRRVINWVVVLVATIAAGCAGLKISGAYDAGGWQVTVDGPPAVSPAGGR